jgi:pimeloyl-ACP methyl ester carboxylesterase
MPETRVAEQSKLLSALFQYNKSGKPAILVGHSLGGPIAARMSINYPKEVGALILVSPSIDPGLEPEEWYRFPLALPFIRWILPASLDMTNREILHLRKELEQMLPLWEEIKAPTTVIQGSKDNLVDPDNAKFAQKMIINAPLKIQVETEADHFIPWNNPGLIKSAILSYLEEVENP